jgi:hypothetical protein
MGHRLKISVADLLAILDQPSSVLQAGSRSILRMNDGQEITDPAAAAAAFSGTPVQSYSYLGFSGEPSEENSFILLAIKT